VVREAGIERVLGDQVSPHHPSLKEGALRINPTEHNDLRGRGRTTSL
jgi:hypothetical protein